MLNLAHALAGHGATNSDAGSTDGSVGGVLPGSVVMDVASLTDAQCLGWAQDVEASLRMGQALAVQVAGELGRRVAAGRFAESGSRGPVGLLVDALQLSASEASRRLKLAQVVLPVVDGISGAVAPVAHPVLGEAFFSGAVSQERASMVTRYLADADRLAAEGRISAETLEQVEESLVDTARVQGPDFVRTVGNQILGHIDPDGHKPSHAELLAKQGLFFHQPRNGLISFHGAVTLVQHEELMAALDGFTNPNKHKNIDTINTGPTIADGGGAGSEVDGCAGQTSLLDELGGLAGLFPSTATATAQPGPPPAPGESADPPGPPDDPKPPDAADIPDAPMTLVQSEPPDAPEQPDPPGPSVAAGETAGGGGVTGGVGWWGRRLEPWEIPARPPEAPEYATPPVYEGQ
ncbi:DUF222 domain-containing protein, partial [Arthrobacter sp. HY1533]|uniref:DUF222 domain-containing protein n=1 Tax=Arthrobacter sp. HY1533 TaxID=2970919 RepID=UPI002FD4C94A